MNGDASQHIEDPRVAQTEGLTINKIIDKKYPDYRARKDNKIRNELTPEAIAQSTDALTAQAQETVAIERSSKIDSLTGLLRQGAFNEAFDRAVEDAKRDSLRVIFTAFDIDYFKKFNDSYGHQAGDKLLSEFGKNLKQNMRGTDILGRVGGEEFAVVGVPATQEEKTKRVPPRTLFEAFDSGLTIAEKIRAAAPNMEIIDINGRRINGVTISCGLTFSNNNESPERIRLRADAALYLAKAQGRNCLVVAMPQGDESTIFYLATPKKEDEKTSETREHFEYRELKIVPNDQLTRIKEIVK